MNRQEFGDLTAALRKELFDKKGNRLTQAKLAKKIGTLDPRTPLSDIVIGKIERGERAILDNQTLLNLADGLELTIGERHVFFLLATGLDHLQIYPDTQKSEQILNNVLTMLADIRQPALLLDRYLDVIAANELLLKLYHMSDINLSGLGNKVNLLDFIFSDAFAKAREQMTAQTWHQFAVGNMIYFRRMTLPYRMTPYFKNLFAHLHQNREFRWFWEQILYEEKRYFVGGESFQMGGNGFFDSAKKKRFRFLTAPLTTHTPFGNLEIITHIPRNEETAVAFQNMAKRVPSKAHQFSSWPHKKQQE